LEASPESASLNANRGFLGADVEDVDVALRQSRQDAAAVIAELKHDSQLVSSADRLGDLRSGPTPPSGPAVAATEEPRPVLALKTLGGGGSIGIDAERRLENKINSVNHRLIIRVAEVEERVQQVLASDSGQARLQEFSKDDVEIRCRAVEQALVEETEGRRKSTQELSARLDAISTRADTINDALASKKEESSTDAIKAALAQMKSEHNTALSQLRAELDQRVLNVLEVSHRQSAEQTLQNEHKLTERLVAIQREQQVTSQRLESSQTQEIDELRAKVDSQARELRQKFADRMEESMVQLDERLQDHKAQHESLRRQLTDMERLLTSNMVGQARQLEELQEQTAEQERRYVRDPSLHFKQVTSVLEDHSLHFQTVDDTLASTNREMSALPARVRGNFQNELASQMASLHEDMHVELTSLEAKLRQAVDQKFRESLSTANAQKDAIMLVKTELRDAIAARASQTLEEAERGARQCYELFEERSQVERTNARNALKLLQEQTSKIQKTCDLNRGAFEKAHRSSEQRLDASLADVEHNSCARERQVETVLSALQQRHATIDQRCAAQEHRQLLNEQRMAEHADGLQAVTARCADLPDHLETKLDEVRRSARDDITACIINSFHGEVKLWSTFARAAATAGMPQTVAANAVAPTLSTWANGAADAEAWLALQQHTQMQQTQFAQFQQQRHMQSQQQLQN